MNAGAAATAENGIQSCTNVVVTAIAGADGTTEFGYAARHNNGSTPGLFYVRNGGGVTTVLPVF